MSCECKPESGCVDAIERAAKDARIKELEEALDLAVFALEGSRSDSHPTMEKLRTTLLAGHRSDEDTFKSNGEE